MASIKPDDPETAPKKPKHNLYGQSLSKQELKVVKRLSRGMDYFEIAEDMGLSYYTVRTYASRIRLKIGVHSQAQIVAWYATKKGRDPL